MLTEKSAGIANTISSFSQGTIVSRSHYSLIRIKERDIMITKMILVTTIAILTCSGCASSGLISGDSNSAENNSSSNSWFSSVPQVGPANKDGTIVFNPRQSTYAAYNSSGELVRSGRASGGMHWCEDIGRSCRTPVGTFRVFAKGNSDCISNTYPLEDQGGAPMPNCMYFKNGYAIHGSDYVPDRPASHGCVRVTPSTAEWLNHNFVKIGTVVKVESY